MWPVATILKNTDLQSMETWGFLDEFGVVVTNIFSLFSMLIGSVLLLLFHIYENLPYKCFRIYSIIVFSLLVSAM